MRKTSKAKNRLLSMILSATVLLSTQDFTVLADTVKPEISSEMATEQSGTEQPEESASENQNISDMPEVSGLNGTEESFEILESTQAEGESESSESEPAESRDSVQDDTQGNNSLPEDTENLPLEEVEEELFSGSPANPIHHCTKKNDGSDYTDWSYVYFGSYPQTEVTGSELTSAIVEAIYDGNGDAWVDGTKYRRISKSDTNYGGYFGDSTYRYFKWERIKWRVLQNNGYTLFVVADRGLDCKNYNETWSSIITWEKCTLRNWLNDTFYNIAFSNAEQRAVIGQNVINEDNPYYNTEGGNDTKDKVYLLSIGESTELSYGFCEDYGTYSISRRVGISSYAQAMGAGNGNASWGCIWWLRSPGDATYYTADVGNLGNVNVEGQRVYSDFAVTPVLHINLSSNLWSTTDDGTSGSGGEDGTSHPTDLPTATTSPDSCTLITIDSDYHTPIQGAAFSFGGKIYTSDENGMIKFPVPESQSGKDYIVGVESEGYFPSMQGITLGNGKVIYINLYSETGGFTVTSAKGTLGGESKNLLNQKMYFGTNENNVSGTTENFSITLQGRGGASKYELIADGQVIAENTTGNFSFPVITKSGGKSLEMPLFPSNAPFKAGQDIKARVTNQAGEQATVPLGIKICKNGHKIDEIKKSGKISLGEEIKLTLSDTVPFVGGNEVSFGLEDALPLDLEFGGDGKVKISVNKPADQDISLFKEEYDKLSSRAQNLSDSAKAFGGTPQSFGGGYFKVTGSVMGYGEGYLGEADNGKLTVNVGVILSVKASAGYTQYFFAGAIPFYVSIEGGVSVSSELKAGGKYDNGNFSINGGFGDMSGKIFLKADAGVGVKEMVSVEIEGNAGLNLLWKPSNNYQKLYMTDSLAIHSSLFGWKADLWSSGTQERLLYENQPDTENVQTLEKAAALPENMYDLSLYRLQDRHYLEEAVEEKAAPKGERNGDGSAIKQSVYPQAEPKLIDAGGKSFLFWLEDNGERSIENRGALVYASSTDGENWSVPVQLVEESRNQTADYQYDLDTDGEKIYVTYTEGTELLPSGSNLQEITRKMCVTYAVIDVKSGKAEKVTSLASKPGCYMFPQVIVYRGTPYSAWVFNDLNGGGMFDDGNKYTVTLKNMKTGKICYEKIQKSGDAVVSMDIGYAGDASVALPSLACQFDTDGKLATAGDREIVLIDGKSPNDIMKLTSNAVIDANPTFALLDGKGCLFWYQDGKLMCWDNKDSREILEKNISGFNCSFAIIPGNSGEGKVIWSASPLEKEGNCIYAADYQGGGKWSVPYLLAETGSDYTTYPNGYARGGDTVLTYLKSEKQADGSSLKSIYVTREASYTEISLDGVWYDEGGVGISKNLPLTLTVSNRGSQKVDRISVTCDGAVIADISSADLKTGETKEYTVNGFKVSPDIVKGIKNYSIGISAQGDKDTGNNQKNMKLGYTDLYLKTDTVLQDGENCVNVSVLNNSDIPSKAVLRLYGDKEDGKVLWEKELDTISKDNGIGMSVPLGGFSGEYCTFYLAVEAEKEEGVLGNNRELIYTGFGTGMEGGELVPDALTFQVSFDSAGGSRVDPQQIESYMKAVEPLPPFREGYHFLGWYQGENLYDFNREVTGDITLTAKWREYEKAAAPDAGIASGSRVAKDTRVNLTCATEGADIYYTTDGSLPTASSLKYSQSVIIDRNMTVKAIAIKQGYKNSDVAEFAYTVYERKDSTENGNTDTSAGKKIKVKKLSISGISKKIAAGKKVSLKVTVSPKNASNSKVKWKTSNKKYATVNSKGVVTTKKAGKGKTVTITATAADGSKVKASYKIKLMKHQVKKVKISNAKKTLKAGKTMQLKGKVTANGKNANKTLKWSTSNKKYATVDKKGKVKAKKAGKGKTVTITAQSTDGTNKKAKIKIKIK